jgi:hypothetical protein
LDDDWKEIYISDFGLKHLNSRGQRVDQRLGEFKAVSLDSQIGFLFRKDSRQQFVPVDTLFVWSTRTPEYWRIGFIMAEVDNSDKASSDSSSSDSHSSFSSSDDDSDHIPKGTQDYSKLPGGDRPVPLFQSIGFYSNAQPDFTLFRKWSFDPVLSGWESTNPDFLKFSLASEIRDRYGPNAREQANWTKSLVEPRSSDLIWDIPDARKLTEIWTSPAKEKSQKVAEQHRAFLRLHYPGYQNYLLGVRLGLG